MIAYRLRTHIVFLYPFHKPPCQFFCRLNLSFSIFQRFLPILAIFSTFLFVILKLVSFSLQIFITASDAYRLSASRMIGILGNLLFIFSANLLNAFVSQSCFRSSSFIVAYLFASSPLFSINSLPRLTTSICVIE